MKKLWGGLVLSFVAATIVAVPAMAATSLSSIGGYYDMVVDNTHHHVFVSPGNGHSSIAVMDFSGNLVTTFTGGSGASGMVLSADDTKLFVALRSADEIDEFDTTTYAKITSFATTGGSCPDTLARRGNVIWAGFGCQSSGGGIGSVDPTAVTPTFTTYTCGCFYDPFIVIPSTNQDVLFACDRGLSPCTVYRFDISTGTPMNGTSKFDPGPDGCSNLGSMAASPDGSKLYLACGHPYEIFSIKGSDLTNAGTFPGNPYPTAVALAPDGDHVAGGMDGYYTDNDIDAFRISTGTMNFHYADQSSAALGVAGNGLDYASDGTLFAVFSDGSNIDFRTFSGTTLDPSSISGSAAPNPVAVGSPTTLTGSLTFPAGGTVGVQTLHVKRENWDGSETALTDQATNSSGNFSFDETSSLRATGYKIAWDGDSTHQASTNTIPVNVTGNTTTLTISLSSSTISYHGSTTVTAHLGATGTSRSVTIYYQPYGSQPAVLTSGNVDGSGNIARTYAPAKKTSYYAVFNGDEATNPITSSTVTVLVRALAGVAPTGYYSHSGSWFLYHYNGYCPKYHTHCPTFNGVITPNHAGRTISFLVQGSINGKWYTVVSNSFTIPSSGTTPVYFYYSSTNVENVPLRIRCSFAGDADHLGATSNWRYFQVKP